MRSTAKGDPRVDDGASGEDSGGAHNASSSSSSSSREASLVAAWAGDIWEMSDAVDADGFWAATAIGPDAIQCEENPEGRSLSEPALVTPTVSQSTWQLPRRSSSAVSGLASMAAKTASAPGAAM